MNFLKVVKMAMRFRWTFAAAMFCALIVAAFWGGNIGALYPVVEVTLKGDTLQDWVAREIQKAEKNIADAQEKAESIRTEIASATGTKKTDEENRLSKIENQIAVESRALGWYVYLRPYIDKFLPNDPFKTIVVTIGIFLIGTIIKDTCIVLSNILVARLAQLATFDLRKLFYRRTLHLDVATFNDEGTSDLMSRFTNDMSQVATGIETLFGKLIREPLKMIACLIGAAFVSWQLLLLSLLVAPVAGFLINWLAKTLKRANRRAMEGMAVIFNTLEETFRNVKIIKAFTSERRERARFHADSKSYMRRAMKIARLDALVHPTTEILGIVAVCIATLAGAWLVIYKQTHLFGIKISDRPIDTTQLVLFYAFLAAAADPIRKFSDVFSRLQTAEAAADRIFACLEREPKICDPIDPVPAHRHQLMMEFAGVHFSYKPEKPVLNGINLKIRFGETIAIVGPNGSGKSTLAHLIPRFADPDRGEIRLDGAPLSAMRLKDVRGQVGLVTQETSLFDDTIFNNIRYGTPQATREQVLQAAKQAHAHTFIENDLPLGYETVVGTLGGRLSGGQRQRIALARAILRDPSILILDEATSQVDLESEQAIQKVLEKFIVGRTTIIITHRLSILALADRVVVLQDGCVADVGRHDELLGRCELYRRLHAIQFEDLRMTA